MSIYDTYLPTWEGKQLEIDAVINRIKKAEISTEGMIVSAHPKGVRITVKSRRDDSKRATQRRRDDKE